jgi:hypothetical protein
MPCGSCKNGRFGGTYRLHHQDDSVLLLLVTVKVFPTSPILVTLTVESTLSSETSAHTRETWRHIPEDALLHSAVITSKSYIALTGWTL